MAERRAGTKGRRLGSSRRKQLRESSCEAAAAAPGPSEEPPWASEIVKRVQDFFREQDKDQAGFVTRSDMKKLQEEDFPCSMEELELVFDGLDAAGTGRLSTEEFTAGLWQFLNSQKAARDHRRRKTASRRVRLVLPSPTLEGADSEERRHFAAFMDQLGTDNISEEQEIWQLWVKLRQDEPKLLGNLEDFLAKMRHRIQEARSKKEALEVTLNKRVAEHDKDVQQLCEALEQQIEQEQQRLQQESVARSHQHSVELQRALDASEREVQRLVTAQMELETRCRSLRSTQQAASTENRQLEESNRVLEDRLQHLHQQLQQTHRRLQTARAAMVWEHMEEPGDRAVAELPGETPLSPQMSPVKSEKHRSEMRIRLGSQSGEPKAKSIHQVVWEMPPAEISLSGAPRRMSSVEEDPFPEFLKEEHFSDQSSLLREMNDAIAALSKQLKPQAPGAPPDAAHHPRDDAEPQMGPEAATAHGTTPGVLQETLPGHMGHELVEGDLKEGPATAELCAPDVTQAGASVGAGHHRAQEPGAEQGESPEEARSMLFLEGKGAGVKELMLKVTEHPQGAPGESTEAGEQALMEVEGKGRMQEKTGWEKAQPPGEVEEAALSQGENLEAGLGPPEAGDTGLAAGWQLAVGEPGPAAAPGGRAQPLGAGRGEEADPPSSGLSEELEIKPGERLEPEPPSRGQARMGAAQGDGDSHPEVTAAPGPAMLEEEHVGAEAQPWGETLDADELPARAQHGGSRGAGAEEGEVEAPQRREAEPQPQGESARGGSVGAEVPAAVPAADVREGGVGTDVQPLEAHSSNVNVQLLAEVEAALQSLSEAGSPGREQGRSVDPDVQPLEEDDKPELGLGEEKGTAAVRGEGPSPAESPAGSPDMCELFPVEAQALELVEAEDSQEDVQLCGGASLETSQGGGDNAATQLMEEADGGEQGHGERGLPHEHVPHPHGVTIGQGEGADAGVQPWEEAESLDVLEDQSTAAHVQLTAEADELKLTPGGSTEADLQLSSEVRSPGTEQGWSVDPHVEHLDQVDKEVLVEEEVKDSQADRQLCGSLIPEVPWGGQGGAGMQDEDEDEDGAQGQDEHELPHEPVLDPQGAGIGQGEGADTVMQPWKEAESLDVLEDQSTAANMQLIAEADELKLTPGGSTETELQPLIEAGSSRTEQGGSRDPDVEPLDHVDKAELVEMVEAEDSQAHGQLCEHPSLETLQGGEENAATQRRDEDEDVAQVQGENELPHEPMFDPQGEGTDAGVQLWEEAESLDVLEDQSTAANLQITAEADELKLTLGGSTEADLQLLSEVRSPGTEQGGSMAPDVEPLDQVDKEVLVEEEVEDAQADTQLCGSLIPEAPWGGQGGAGMQDGDEDEDGAQWQDKHELPHEPVLDPQGAGIGQGEGADAGVQPWEEAESLDVLEDQSTAANVQLIAEADELKLTPGGSTETELQSLIEAGFPGTEQGGSQDPDVEPLDHVDKAELVEMVEAEDSQAHRQLCEHPSLETLQGGEENAATQFRDEDEDVAQVQGENELPHEPMFDPQGAGVGQGEGADTGMQPWKEAESLDVLEDQSTAAHVQLTAEADELKLTPGGSTEADLQLSSEVRSPGTEQGWSVDPHVEHLDQVDKEVLVEEEVKDSQADRQLCGSLIPEVPWGGQGGAGMQDEDEDEDGAQGQDEHELPHEPVLDPQGAGIGQGEGADTVMQPWKEAESLDVLEDQSTAANMQLIAEADELKLTPGGSTETELQPLIEAGSSRTEQGGSRDPDVEPLDHVDKAELVEMVEAEDSQAHGQLCEHPSLETLQGGEENAATQRRDEDEDVAQVQGENELPHEPMFDPQGEGTDAGVQLWEEAESLDVLEDQSTAANLQITAEADELKLTLGGSTEADLQLLSEVRSPGTEQGGSMAPDVEPLDQVDKEVLVEEEVEDAQADTQLCGSLIPEAPWGGQGGAGMQDGDEDEDGAQWQDKHELPHEPVLDPQGAGIGQGEGADAGVQPWEEAESLDVLEDQSTAANVQLIAEADELKLTPGGSTETELQSLIEAGFPGTEQGGSQDPDVEPLDHVDKAELVEMVEAEDSQAHRQLCEHPSLETLQGGEENAATQFRDEDEDVAQVQGENELPHEPMFDPQGAGVGQGEGADTGMQPWKEAESLDVLEDQSTAAHVQLTAEADELKLTPGGSTEADLQLSSEVRSPGTEQGWSVDPHVEHLDQVDKEVLVEEEVKDSQADRQLCGSLIPEVPWGGQGGAGMQDEDEDEDGAQGQDEHELPHEPVLDPQGAGIGQGEGADTVMQPWKEAESLDVLEDQSTAANMQLIAEADELKLTPGGSTETELQPLIEAGSSRTEQGGSRDPDVEPLDHVDKAELVEMVEAEDSQAHGQLCEHPSLETLQGGEENAATQRRDEDEDVAQVQGENELPHEPMFDPQGEGTDAGVQLWEEAESLDVLEDQSTAANLQITAEADELKLTLGGSTEADLQLLSEVRSPGTEQGGSMAPDVEPLDQVDKEVLVEEEVEDAQADTQLCGSLIPEAPWGGQGGAGMQDGDEDEDGAQWQDKHELPHEPVLDPQGAGIGQGEGTDAGVQPWEEAESLDVLEDQSTAANVQLIAEAEELKLTPGGSTETDLQPLIEAGSPGTEQGWTVAPDVKPLDQVDKLELVELEAEDTQLCEHLSLETIQGGVDRSAMQLMEEADGGAQGHGENELPHEPVLDPQAEGAGAGVQLWEEAESLDVLEAQSNAAYVQLIAEADELKLTPGGSTEAELQPLNEAGSPGTEQGGSVAPDIEPLDQVDKEVLVEVEIEDAQADTQLCGSLSPKTPWGGQGGVAMHLRDEDADGAQWQDEHELPHDPMFDPQGAGVGQGEGADTVMQPWKEAESLDVLEDQSTAANVQLIAEAEESGGSTGADLTPLGAVGMQEGEQSPTSGLEAALCAAHTTDLWERPAGGHVSPPAMVTLQPERAAAAEGPGLEAKLGALTGPDGQILEDTQPLELPQGERDAVEGRPLDGAQGLEAVQGEMLEAGARSLVKAQGLGLKQGHDDGASALASPVSKVPLQISTLKLETMMQEDVLIPDVRRLGASGQAAQSELQEQVSAQADKVRLHTASQPPEDKPPHVMETEQVAAGSAEPPQQEVPPVSTLQMRVQQEEDAGNDQLGVVLEDSSLRDAATSSTWPQRQLLGEQREDFNVGQQEKQQEIGRKTTQRGEPSPGESGTVTAGGAGHAPRGSAEACLDPDHLYNVLFVGNSHVGKTSFLYRLHAKTFNPHITTTIGLDYQVTMLIVDNKRFALRLWDSAGTERYHSITKQFFRKADGVVLMYDITSEHSFSDVRYWLSCIQEGAINRVPILLLGNKTDCAADRRVPTKEGERLAKEHQLMFYECSAASGHNVSESMVSLIRLLKVHEDKLKTEAEEIPKPPQKKKGCC